jgi:hypothetical protein
MATPIDFPTSSLPGHFGSHPGESQGRLLNVFVEQEKEQAVWKRVPGTRFFTDVGVRHPRGFIEVDGAVYGAYENVVKRIAADGTVSTLTGVLAGTDRVTWAKNNQLASPPRGVVVVTELGAYVVTPTTVANYPGTILPIRPSSVCHLDGYFFFTYAGGDNTGRIYASELNSTDVHSDSFTTAEGNPDGVLRGIVAGRQLFAMGQASIEVYQNVGSSPFPLARSAVIPVGLLGTFAAAGGTETDGWDGMPMFVARDGTVRQFKGYEPVIVSTRTVERFIAAQPDPKQLTAYVYTFLGSSIWGIKGNGGSPDERCFEYNTSSGQWHERQSQGQLTWRGHRTVWAFDRWLVGDAATTELRYMDALAQAEHQDPIPCRIESKLMKNFPAALAVPRADFMFAQGVGIADGQDPIQTNPVVEISWSDDGGGTWSRPLRRTLGRQAEFGWGVRLNRTGMTTQLGRRWRIDVADPVPYVFFGASMDIEERAT